MELSHLHEFFAARLPDIKRIPLQASTNATTLPRFPRAEECVIDIWTEFYNDFMRWSSSLPDRPIEKYVVKLNPKNASCEASILAIWNSVVSELMGNIFAAFDQNIDFVPPNGVSMLNSDLVLLQIIEDMPILKAVIEFKTPWALPVTSSTDLVKEYHREIDTIRKLIETQIGQPATMEQIFDKAMGLSRKDTKIIRLIGQIYGYMSVNHLKYGIVTTYEWTFFLQRVPREKYALPHLQISKPVPKSNLVRALTYFCNLTITDHLYASPYSTPVLKRSYAKLSRDIYNPQAIKLGQIYMDSPKQFSELSSVARGRSLSHPGKSAIFKMRDGSKSQTNNDLFSKEICVYQKARELQGLVIPELWGTYVASGFILVLEMSDCGKSFSGEDESTKAIYKADILKVFQVLHQADILHGDVAWRNILLGTDGKVRLVDFEMSKFRGDFASQIDWKISLDEENELVENLFN